MRIAITGATGLLGRNLLFEVLKNNLSSLDKLEVIVFGRKKEKETLSERIKNILETDGLHYLRIAPNNASDKLREIENCILEINFDLMQDQLALSSEDFKLLKSKKIDFFFHVAALTDFRSDSSTAQRLEDVNVKGTERIIKLVAQLDIGQFIYVGSAYSSGHKLGIVDPHYINLHEEFRNPYERSKLLGEITVRNFCESKGVRYKIFRPSTICGRLLEMPRGSINKFDVFYAWVAFFLRHKANQVKELKSLFDEPFELRVRIKVDLTSGLNIVPADYAAKILYHSVCSYDDPAINYHLANPVETKHKDYIRWMLESVNIHGFSFVEQEPQNKTELEKLYYKTVGRIFTPYIERTSLNFRVDSALRIGEKVGIECPVIDQENFKHLMDYAKQQKFGIKTKE